MLKITSGLRLRRMICYGYSVVPLHSGVLTALQDK
jgi:hypothetical protein